MLLRSKTPIKSGCIGGGWWWWLVVNSQLVSPRSPDEV